MSVAVAFSLLFIFLAWVGWRFFVAPPLRVEPRVRQVGIVPLLGGKLVRGVVAAAIEFRQCWQGWREHSLSWVLAAVGIALAVVGLILMLTTHVGVTRWSEMTSALGAKIRLTLSEEQLVPPPPLPPQVFSDAFEERPGLSEADRDWAKLEPHFMAEVLQVMQRAQTRGYTFVLLEGYRSSERQNQLATQAIVVTRAKGGQSKHQLGLAVDLAPLRDGRVVISEQDTWAAEAYRVLGEEAESAGLVWGGRWSLRDYGHLERAGSMQQFAGSSWALLQKTN